MEIRTKIPAETVVSAGSESQPFDYSSENRFNSAISSAQRDSSGVSRISGIFRKEGIHILYFLKYAGLSLLLSPEINDFYGAQIRCGTLLDPPALAGMARRNGIHPPVRIGAAALDQRFVRRFPPLVVESFRLGAPHLRTLECFYDLVDLAGHSRRPFRREPIFSVNSGKAKNPEFFTTAQTFGDQLHAYTIVDAINDNNVLPFRVDYIKTMDVDEEITDEMVWDINREKAMMAPKRIELVTKYILDHFDQKTYRGDKTYIYNTLTNIQEVASAERGAVEEIKRSQRLSGFNSIFAVASVPMAKLYYQEFKRQMELDPTKHLRIATIFSYAANEEEVDGLLDEENPEDTTALDQTARDFLDGAIDDYNKMFHTNYSTDGDRFQNYYKDVSLRMKNKEIDLLIVVNMFLTGFDATTLNTLWVDKNLKMHGLIQAFSRTNRILNSIKTFGNIVCFRNLQKRVDSAISLFGDKNAGGIVLLQSFKDYYYGYESVDGEHMPGYVDMVEELKEKFPLMDPQIIGEQNQKAFIALFGAFLRMRNLLLSFDEYKGNELISERDLQDYLGRYQDLRDEWRRKRENNESTDITDDIVFEVELIKQIEINIDYILMLVKKYHDTHCEDKEVLITIKRAVEASPELRSKKALIESFIAGINDVEDVMAEWREFVVEQRENDLAQLISEERLNPENTRRYIENAFRDGEIRTAGTDIDKLMPPVSRFGGSGRDKKKQAVIEKLKQFFEKYYGVGGAMSIGGTQKVVYGESRGEIGMVAEEKR